MNPTKYKLIIHTMMKDEDNLIYDFVMHHILNIGFEHIYIYDDNSIVSIQDHIKIMPPDVQQKVTVIRIDFDILNKNDLIKNNFYDEDIFIKCGKYKQKYIQTYFTKNNYEKAEWCFYCDADEFIYLKENVNIHDILTKYDDYNSIYIPWLIYGSSYYYKEEEQKNRSVLEMFRLHSEKYDNSGKSIVKMASIKDIIFTTTHFIHNTKPYVLNYFGKPYDTDNDIHICHYNIQCIQTYIRRKLRHEIGNKEGHVISVNGLLFNVVSFNDISQCNMLKYYQYIHPQYVINIIDLKKEHPVIYAYNKIKFAVYNKKLKMYFMTTENITYEDLDDILNNKNKITMLYEDDLFDQKEVNEFKKLNPGLKVLDKDTMMYIYFNSKNL